MDEIDIYWHVVKKIPVYWYFLKIPAYWYFTKIPVYWYLLNVTPSPLLPFLPPLLHCLGSVDGPTSVLACSSLPVRLAEAEAVFVGASRVAESLPEFYAESHNSLTTLGVAHCTDAPNPWTTFYTLVADFLWSEGAGVFGLERLRVVMAPEDDSDSDGDDGNAAHVFTTSVARPHDFFAQLPGELYVRILTRSSRGVVTCHSCGKSGGQTSNLRAACNHVRHLWHGFKGLLCVSQGGANGDSHVDDVERVMAHFPPSNGPVRHLFLPPVVLPADNAVAIRHRLPLTKLQTLFPASCSVCGSGVQDSSLVDDGHGIIMSSNGESHY